MRVLFTVFSQRLGLLLLLLGKIEKPLCLVVNLYDFGRR